MGRSMPLLWLSSMLIRQELVSLMNYLATHILLTLRNLVKSWYPWTVFQLIHLVSRDEEVCKISDMSIKWNPFWRFWPRLMALGNMPRPKCSGVVRAFPTLPPGRPNEEENKENLRENWEKIQENEERLRKHSYLAHPGMRGWLRPWPYGPLPLIIWRIFEVKYATGPYLKSTLLQEPVCFSDMVL